MSSLVEIPERDTLKVAESLEKVGNGAEAVKIYLTLSNSLDFHVSFWANRNAAYLLRDLNDLSQATILAEKAWVIDKRLDVGLLLSSLHRNLKNFDRAQEVINELLAEFPDEADVHVSCGDLFMGMGLPNIRALRAFRRAAALSPDHYWARRNHGVCLRRLGDPAEAVTEFIAAARVSREDDSLLLELADTYFELGDDKNARLHYKSLSTRGPDVIAGALSCFHDSDSNINFIDGWIASKHCLENLRITLGDRKLDTITTQAPNPFARRWEDTSYSFCVGFAAYFDWNDGDDVVALSFVTVGKQEESVMPLARRKDFRLEPFSNASTNLLPAEITSQAIATQLWRESRFKRLIYYLYGQCDLNPAAVVSGTSADSLFLLARALLHEHRFAEAERVCLVLVTARQNLSTIEAAQAVELYCFARAIRCECTAGVDDLKEFLHGIANTGDNGRVGSLINLGHLAALSRDFKSAIQHYVKAIADYPGIPLEFNRSIYAFASSGMQASAFTLEDMPSNVFPDPVFPTLQQQPALDLVHFIACDAEYFRRFVPTLVSASNRAALRGEPRVGLHLHIVNPAMDNLLALTSLLDAGGYQSIAVSVEKLPQQLRPEVKHAYYTTPRFLHAAEILKIYRCPVLITETDCIMNWSWSDLLQWAKRGEVGLMLKEAARTLPLGSKVVAQSVYLDGSANSLRYMESVQAYIRLNFDFDGSTNWTIDQLALWASYEHHRQNVKFFNLDREIISVPDIDKDLFVKNLNAVL